MKNIVETKIIDTVLEKSRIIINIAGTIKYIKFLFYTKRRYKSKNYNQNNH